MNNPSLQAACDDALRRIFGEHPVPASLASIEGYGMIQERSTPPTFFPFDDCMLPGPSGDPCGAWFGAELADKVRGSVIVFLEGGDGFLYALWRHAGQPAAEAPVVYLDDEGSGSGVVASNLDEFLTLAATGALRITPRGLYDPSDEVEPFFTLRGIAPPEDPDAVISAANAAHPDFEAWLEGQRGG